MAVSVGDIQAVFRVIDEASGPLNKIAGEVQNTESGFAKLGGVMKGAVVAATAAVAAITAVGAAVVKIGEYGAGVGDITEQFGKLAEKAGVDATQALNALREATAGTISDLDLMKSALPLLSSGFKGSAEDLRTMAEAARVLSERGMSLDQAMQTVTAAMTTGRTRALAMQGVVIDMQGSMKNLTDATNEEGGAVEASAALHVKQQDILKGLKGLVAENGAVMDDFADKTDQVRVTFANFYNEFARRLSESEALSTVFDRISTAMSAAFGAEKAKLMDTLLAAFDKVVLFIGDVLVVAIEEGIKVFRWLQEVAEGAASSGAWSALVSIFTAIWSVLKLVWDVVMLVGKALVWLGEKLGVFAAIKTGFDMMATGVEWLSTAVSWAVDKVNLLISVFNDLRGIDPGLPEVTGGFDDLNKRGFQPVISASDALQGKLGPLTQGIGEVGGAAKLTTEQMKALAEAEAAMSGAKQIAETDKLIATYDRLAKQGITPTIAAQKALHEAVEATIQIHLQAGNAVPPVLMKIRAATQDAANGLDRWSAETALATEEVWKFGQVLTEEVAPAIAATANLLNVALLPAVVKTGGVFDEMGNRIGELAADAAEGFTPVVQEGDKIREAFGKAVDVMELVSRAAEMAGNKAVASIISIGSAIAKGFASGGIWGAVAAGASSILSSFSNVFFKTEGRKVNDLRDAYVAAAGGIQELARRARAAGMTLDAFLRADTVEEYEEAIASLNTELARTAKLQGELADLQGQLAQRQVMDWERAQELIEKYGGTLGTLGQQFVAAKQAADWQSIWDDWQTLIDMGADVGGVLVSMKDEIQALVQESLRIGTEIPAQFKPLIEELIRTGQLFDASGAAITDIAQLEFGAPLVSELDKLIAKIDELVAALTDHLIPTIGSIPDRLNIKVGYEVDDFPDLPGRGVPEFATGTHGRYPDFGAGTLVALHGRERVMTEAEGSGGDSMTLTIPVYLDASTKLTELVMKKIGRRVKVAGVGTHGGL